MLRELIAATNDQYKIIDDGKMIAINGALSGRYETYEETYEE